MTTPLTATPKPGPILQYAQDLPKHDQRQYQADLTADISNRVAYRRNRRQIRKDADTHLTYR